MLYNWKHVLKHATEVINHCVVYETCFAKFQEKKNSILHPDWKNDSDQTASRHVENLFIQRFLFIHPRFVFIVQAC